MTAPELSETERRSDGAGYGLTGHEIPTADQFWTRVEKGSPEQCWPWMGTRGRRGYGGLYFRGRSLKAHRVAYALANGSLPGGLVVMHRCDNPPCCNPTHLSVGTQADNIRDRDTKGRTVLPYQVPQAERPHGTPAKYRSGCSCTDCLQAERERKTTSRRAAGMKPKARRADQPHGTRARYRADCRCDPCRQAESARKYKSWRG